MINEENKGYTNIPNFIFDLNLTTQELALYIVLLSFYNREVGYAFPSYKQLKERSKISQDRTLIKYIDLLIEKKLLKKETIKGKGNKYYLDTAIIQYLQNNSTCKNTVPPTANIQGEILQKCSTTNTNTNTNTNNICPSDEKVVDIKTKKDKKINKDKKDLEVSEMFEKLWSIYPRKEGKGQARNHFKKLASEYGFEELERVITRYADKCTKEKTEKQFIKMGSTFFATGYEDYLDSNYEETSSMLNDYKPVSDNFN